MTTPPKTVKTYVAGFARLFGAGSNVAGFMAWAEKECPIPFDAPCGKAEEQVVYIHFAHRALQTTRKMLETLEASGLVDAMEAERRIKKYFSDKLGDTLEDCVRARSGGRTKHLLFLFYDEMIRFYEEVNYNLKPAGQSHSYTVSEEDDHA